MISLDKKNLPPYIYKMNLAMVIFFAVWFALGIPLMVTVGCIYDESFITYAVMIATFACFFLGFFIFAFIDGKLHKRLIADRAEELERQFTLMPLEEAERALRERGIMTDGGFAVPEDYVFGSEAVPLDKAWFGFDFCEYKTKIIMKLILFSLDGDEPKAAYDLDRALYSYMIATDAFEDFSNFKLLEKDKLAFAKLVLSRAKTVTFKLRGNVPLHYRYEE